MALARKVLQTEAAAIQALVDRLDGSFEQAVTLLAGCRGRVIVTGIGKSGIICQKIAATFSSTGTPAHFLHPAEAVHGDLVFHAGGGFEFQLGGSGTLKEAIGGGDQGKVADRGSNIDAQQGIEVTAARVQ